MPVQPNIPLGDEFTNLVWTNYTSFDETTRDRLPTQKHLDIRPFTETPILASGGDFLAPEDWELPPNSSTGSEAGTKGFPVLNLRTIENGTVEATSIVKSHPLDFTQFAPTDLIVFTLPFYSEAVVEATSSYIEFIDAQGRSVAIKFSASEVALTGENPYFQVKLERLEEAELSLNEIVGVRFKVAATESIIVYIMGLRLIKATLSEAQPGWVQAPADFDNWNGRYHKTVPLGSLERAPDYQQSIIWKSAPLAGPLDPRAVDTEFGVVFNVGELANSNEFTMYFRQESKIFTTMLDLIGVTMAELDGRPMPDLGTRQFNPRTVGEFDETEMEELDRFDMEELERQAVPNPVLESWVYFTFAWDKTEPSISMGNSSGLSYNFPDLEGLVTLEPKHNYFVVFTLEGSTARARLYDLEQVLEDGGLEELGAGIYEPTGDYFSVKQTPLFDTTIVDDDNVFRRRKGRIGWSTNFQDGDVFLRSIRPRGVTFAEYESAPLESHTPVAGASLFASVLPEDTSLWGGGLALYPEGTTHSFLELDKSRTTVKNGFSYRVTNKGVAKQGEYQGLTTEFMNFTDFEQMQIEFNLWYAGPAREREKIEKLYRGFYPGNRSFPGPERYPGAKVIVTTEPTVASIIAELVSTDGTVIPLVMPELETNQWQHITLRVPLSEVIQTGYYQLRILQQTRLATNWWLDSLKVLQRAVAWSARSVTQDPWGGTYAPWTDFMDVVNDREHNSGISLEPRGKELQLRGRARRQDVTIQKPQIIPRYAELGRLVWPEEAYPTLPQQLENLILNPSFEYDTLATSTPKSWAFPTPGMTLHVSNEWAAVGTKSFKVKTPNNATEYGMFMEHFATGTPVEAGSVYNFQATFNVLELTNERHIFAIIKFYNAKEEHVGTEHFTKHITTTGVHTIKASVTAPEEAVTAEVTPFYIQGDGVAEFYIDKIYFGEGPAYFDGDTAGYHWTGTHGDSRSITTPRPGTPPKAKFKVENKGEVIKFTDESINGVGAIVNREWTFGDGDRIITNDEVVEHTYTKAGVYSVTLQVVDRHGRLNSKVEEVEAT